MPSLLEHVIILLQLLHHILAQKQQRLSDASSRRSYIGPKEAKTIYDEQQTILIKTKQF